MDHIDDPFEPSSTNRDEKAEPGHLLEVSWFFGNLLDRRTKFLRCFSYPCPSSNYRQEMVSNSYSEKSSKNKLKLSKGCELVRTPSMPPCTPREEVIDQENERGSSMRKSNLQSPPHSLVRAPSLPPCIEDTESDFAMSKLIRQASLDTSDVLRPRRASKAMALGSNITSQQPRRKPELDSINTDCCKEMRREYLINQMKMRKSLGDLESKEVQGFRDLGVTFDKEELNPSLVNLLPGFEEKKNTVDIDENKVRRSSFSEPWLVQNSTSPIPNWVDKRSPKDMKAQIKFWARAVASNVQQEC